MKANQIYNQEIRTIIYSGLKKAFGTCDQWVNRSNPTGNIKDYNKWLEDIGFDIFDMFDNNENSEEN